MCISDKKTEKAEVPPRYLGNLCFLLLICNDYQKHVRNVIKLANEYLLVK
jgi:hypothetical protein